MNKAKWNRRVYNAASWALAEITIKHPGLIGGSILEPVKGSSDKPEGDDGGINFTLRIVLPD